VMDEIPNRANVILQLFEKDKVFSNRDTVVKRAASAGGSSLNCFAAAAVPERSVLIPEIAIANGTLAIPEVEFRCRCHCGHNMATDNEACDNIHR